MTPPPARPPGEWVVHVTTAGGADAELAADALWQAGAVAIEERPVASGVVLLAASTPDGPCGIAAPATDGPDGAGTPGGAGTPDRTGTPDEAGTTDRTGTPDEDPGRLMAAVEGQWPAEIVAVDLDAALDAWRPHARAVAAGRFLVRPPWVPRPADAPPCDVVIDPGRAFGSGGHASTRLALVAVDAALPAALAGGGRVLDVGCGSGVLAVAALLAGATTAVGVDIDPAALAASRANAARNDVAARLDVSGDWPPDGDRFDLVVANLLAPALVELAPDVVRRLGRGAVLVLSGLLAGQRADVLAAYPGLTVVATHEEDAWTALTLRP